MAIDNEPLQRQILNIATRVMLEKGIEIQPTLELPLTEDGLGLDSMARMELLQAIEEEAGVNIPERFWDGHGLKNLRDAARIVAKLKS